MTLAAGPRSGASGFRQPDVRRPRLLPDATSQLGLEQSQTPHRVFSGPALTVVQCRGVLGNPKAPPAKSRRSETHPGFWSLDPG